MGCGGLRGKSPAGVVVKVVALICAVVGLALPALARADVGNRSPLEIEFDELSAAIARGDCGEGLDEARRISQRGAFHGFPDQARGAIWTFAAVCADRKGLYDEALSDARNATAVPGATWGVWAFRLRAAVKAKQLEDAPAAVAALAQSNPAVLDALPVNTFRQFKTDAVAAGRGDLVMRVYAALDAANYAPAPKTSDGADTIWLDYAGMAADAGDARRANALVLRLTSVSGLISARLDARFAAAVAADPARFDLEAAALRQLDRDSADMAVHPDHLADLNAVADDLMILERFDDALTLTQAALRRVAQATTVKPAFVDQDDALNWLHDRESRALLRLGRFEAAAQAMREGAQVSEQGHRNVSQTINLAADLNALGRPDQALAELKPVEDVLSTSPYGAGWVHAQRACAFRQLGGAEAQFAPELAWLAAHRRDNTAALLQAQLCAGDAEAVAGELIAELKDPDVRGTALARLSEFDPPRATTPIWAAQLALVAAVRARPDVRAAVAAVGHTERIPLCDCAYDDTQ
jgi:tetratricopeptide (TPR) repeat protein